MNCNNGPAKPPRRLARLGEHTSSVGAPLDYSPVHICPPCRGLGLACCANLTKTQGPTQKDDDGDKARAESVRQGPRLRTLHGNGPYYGIRGR